MLGDAGVLNTISVSGAPEEGLADAVIWGGDVDAATIDPPPAKAHGTVAPTMIARTCRPDSPIGGDYFVSRPSTFNLALPTIGARRS